MTCDLHSEAAMAASVNSPGLLARGGVRGRKTPECADCALCRSALTWLALTFPAEAEVPVPRGLDREVVWEGLAAEARGAGLVARREAATAR